MSQSLALLTSITFLISFIAFSCTSAFPVEPSNGLHINNSGLPSSVHASCSVRGFSFGNAFSSFQCKTFNDVISLGVDNAIDRTNPVSENTMQDEQMSSINDDIIKPIVSGLVGNLHTLASTVSPVGTVLESNMCLGNFDSSFDFSEYKGVCQNLPIDDEWTVFGFALDVGVGSPFQTLCPTVTDGLGTYASVCIAMAERSCAGSNVKIPSVVMSLTTNIFSCQPFDSILAGSSAGASVAVVKAIDTTIESFTFGVSLTNSFRKTFKTYTGDKIVPNFLLLRVRFTWQRT